MWAAGRDMLVPDALRVYVSAIRTSHSYCSHSVPMLSSVMMRTFAVRVRM